MDRFVSDIAANEAGAAASRCPVYIVLLGMLWYLRKYILLVFKSNYYYFKELKKDISL